MHAMTTGRPRSHRLALALGASVLAAGLAGPAVAADPSLAPGDDPSPIVIRIGWQGGFVMPGTDLARFPLLAVAANGTVYQVGAQIDIWPTPLLPPVFISHVSPEQVAALLAQAAEAGLLPGEDTFYPALDVADAPDMVFEIVGPDGTRRTGFGAWGLDQPSMGDEIGRAHV